MKVRIKGEGFTMGSTKVNQTAKVKKEHDTMKGTMFSVGVVGVVIFITYLFIYGLYMARV